MKLIYTIVAMLVVLFVITFALKNATPVPLKYYGVINVEIAAYLLIFISFFVGIIFAGCLDMVERFRLIRKVGSLNKKIKELERKLSNSILMAEEAEPSDQTQEVNI